MSFRAPVTGSDHNPASNSQHTNNTNLEPYLRTPHIELPLFHGDNAKTWITECEDIFALAVIPSDAKVKWANAHIHGRAKTWLASTNISTYFLNWQQFCELLCDRFPEAGEYESMEQFQQLRQVTTVNLCIDQFEKYMIQMKRDYSDLTDKFFLLCFLSGLKDHIKHAVKSHQPSTLRTAYFHARQQELAYMSASRKMPANATVQRTTPAQTFRQNTPDNRE
jgi:hypothetical protein